MIALNNKKMGGDESLKILRICTLKQDRDFKFALSEKLLPIGNLKNICRKQGFYKRYELCKFLTKKTSVFIYSKLLHTL